MGGFALYDGDEFQEYLWGNWMNASSQIYEHHEAVQAAISELDSKKTLDTPLETDATPLIVKPEPQDSTSDLMISSSNLDGLEFLIKNGYIKITEDEIMDNLSHGDSITKIIAVVQTAWFLLQVGARAVEGLAITEIEVITVGFAVLNFGTYFLWWNKPLRVRHPVRVYWRHQEVAEKKDVHSENKGAKGWVDKVQEFIVGVWDSIREASAKFGRSMVVLFNFLKDPFEEDPELNDNSLPNMKWVTLLRLVGLPFLVVLRLITTSVFIIADVDDDYMASVVNSSSLEEESITLYILVYGLTTLFGAIHCIPWNFQFPTHTEQLLWRISAGGLVALPLTLLVVIAIGMAISLLDNAIESRFGKDSRIYKTMGAITEIFIGYPTIAIGVTLPFAYIIARVVLMVLALMELRNLPSSAYQTVQWTTLIPHIG
ncbi:hypothetical protein VNI00_017628 [Paramarasmius palmivorus]|uniref:Uncharacterized protein n=1 Tax=Paramarasmius palmivorus TaxID=297713 RepID=A0AAW0B5Z6_9AGAR